jgi:hypothetical protein
MSFVRLPTALWRRDSERHAQWVERAAWAESREMGRWSEIEPTLHQLVTQQIEVLRPLPTAERLRLGRGAAESLPEGGADLLFGAEGALVEDLARVLAVLAYQPGGVFAFGQRWCAGPAPSRKSAPREVEVQEAELCTTCRDYDWRSDIVCPDCRAGEWVR